jgi:GDP-4-dehydro-6-deoxy-D-mannose reductase
VIEVGPLSSTRDYVSLEDATGQLLAIAAHGEPGEVYHVASGKPITMREFLARFLAEHDICISAVQEAAELSNRTGYDVPMIYADVSRTSQMVESWRSSVKA